MTFHSLTSWCIPGSKPYRVFQELLPAPLPTAAATWRHRSGAFTPTEGQTLASSVLVSLRAASETPTHLLSVTPAHKISGGGARVLPGPGDGHLWGRGMSVAQGPSLVAPAFYSKQGRFHNFYATIK